MSIGLKLLGRQAEDGAFVPTLTDRECQIVFAKVFLTLKDRYRACGGGSRLHLRERWAATGKPDQHRRCRSQGCRTKVKDEGQIGDGD